ILTENVGVYLLNTAMCSMAGLNDDRNRLHVNTRDLHQWCSENNCKYKILVMHHPLDWLSDWAQRELKGILSKHFSLVFIGHTHEQSAYHINDNAGATLWLHAPPFFTSKHDHLGYSIVDFS